MTDLMKKKTLDAKCFQKRSSRSLRYWKQPLLFTEIRLAIKKILAKKLMSARCAEFWEQDARLLFVHLNPIHFNLIIFLRWFFCLARQTSAKRGDYSQPKWPQSLSPISPSCLFFPSPLSPCAGPTRLQLMHNLSWIQVLILLAACFER